MSDLESGADHEVENKAAGEPMQLYKNNWGMVFKPDETRRVFIQDSKGKLNPVYLPLEQWNTIMRATAPGAKLSILEQVMKEQEDAVKGKTYGPPMPVSPRPVRNSNRINEYTLQWAINAFTDAGYEVHKLHASPFDFAAQLGNGENSRTYYVLVKCGKRDSRSPLSQRQLRRMKEQPLIPRYGMNVTKLYWYICTANNSHRVFQMPDDVYGHGMKPIPHPIEQFTGR